MMTDLELDHIILDIFDAQSEEFFYPITTQRVARDFVQALRSKGVSFEILYMATGEIQPNFDAWRRGLGRSGIGRRMIDRINRPINALLMSGNENESDEEELKMAEIIENVLIKDMTSNCNVIKDTMNTRMSGRKEETRSTCDDSLQLLPKCSQTGIQCTSEEGKPKLFAHKTRPSENLEDQPANHKTVHKHTRRRRQREGYTELTGCHLKPPMPKIDIPRQTAMRHRRAYDGGEKPEITLIVPLCFGNTKQDETNRVEKTAHSMSESAIAGNKYNSASHIISEEIEKEPSCPPANLIADSKYCNVDNTSFNLDRAGKKLEYF